MSERNTRKNEGGKDRNKKRRKGRNVRLFLKDMFWDPTDGVSTLLWWLGLSAPETLRTMPAVA
jgi:hypothetical protein